MMKTQQYSQQLQKLFILSSHSLKIDLTVLKQICSTQDYRRLIDLTSILFKLFKTGRQILSMRQLVGQSLYPTLNRHSTQPQKQGRIDFFVDGLTPLELTTIIKQLIVVRKKLKYTIYSIKLAQIIEMLKKVLCEVRVEEVKKEDLCILGDVEIMQEQYRKYLSSSIFQTNPQPKMSQFLKNPKPFLQNKFTNTATLLKLIAIQIMPHLEKRVLSIPLANHTEREGEISRILNFIQNYFIVQYQIQVEISKNTLVETRIYNNKFQKELLFRYRKMIIRASAKIFNQAILCPSSINIQILLFRILRRLYFLQDYSNSQHHQYQYQNDNTNIVRNPLFLVIRNIALFSQGREEELKQAAMFTYKAIQDKNDIELVTLFENCQELRFLKSSKFYSSKAYTFADEIQKIYEPTQLGSLYPKNYHNIAARQIWAYTLLIQKPSSLISWEFFLTGYDIKFAIYKIEHLRDMSLDDYQKGVDCRQVLKFEKVMNTASNPNKGHVYLKNGVYRIVFDNSFSMIRSKEIYYTFLHLQST